VSYQEVDVRVPSDVLDLYYGGARQKSPPGYRLLEVFSAPPPPPPGKYCDSRTTQIRLQSCPKSFLIHQSSHHLTLWSLNTDRVVIKPQRAFSYSITQSGNVNSEGIKVFLKSDYDRLFQQILTAGFMAI
jgi:hypothetical protein